MLGRAAFAVVFFTVELSGVLWGQTAPDRVIGFQMFNESSRITIHLSRELRRKGKTVRVPMPNGRWRARDARGTMRDYDWQTRVRGAPLNVLEQSVHASYGLDAQLFRLQAALNDAVRHIPDDTQTLALVAEVDTIRNGRPGPRVTLRAEKP